MRTAWATLQNPISIKPKTGIRVGYHQGQLDSKASSSNRGKGVGS